MDKVILFVAAFVDCDIKMWQYASTLRVHTMYTDFVNDTAKELENKYRFRGIILWETPY